MPLFKGLKKLNEKVPDHEINPTPTYEPVVNQDPVEDPEDPEEEPEEEAGDTHTCISCKHHSEDFPDDYEHACMFDAEEQTDFVTGEETWDGIEDCHDKNEDGDCEDWEPKA